MIHVTITDLETNEVKLDRTVNDAVIGTSDDEHISGTALGTSLKAVVYAFSKVEDIIEEVEKDNPEFWPIYDFVRAMQAIKDDDDADE